LHDQKINLPVVKHSPLKAAGVPSDIKSFYKDEYKTCARETRPRLCFNSNVLIGKTSVLDEQEDGRRYDGRIVEPVEEE
jgi:hypothetical protein